ncbi:MAG: putative Ig domain-containing protein [Acidobacteriaceae bacterium]|nr:putative Ig domain-containing protein [Acidobacteriaceae bacterium]
MTYFAAKRFESSQNEQSAAVASSAPNTSIEFLDPSFERWLGGGQREDVRSAVTRVSRIYHLACFGLLLLLLVGALFGCGGGYAGTGLDSITSSAHTIDATQAVTLQTSSSATVPVQWSMKGDTCGDTCGSLSSSGHSAVYAAPASLDAAIHVAVTAGISGTQSKQSTTITVNPAVAFVGTPASGIVGTPYSYTVATTGGTGSVALSLVSGTLPDGLAFNSATGLISGTPTTEGTFTFVLRALDQSDLPFSINLTATIVITTAATPLAVTPVTLPVGTVGTAYSAGLTATGGAAPYTWTVASGSLPSGLALTSGGVVTGTPTAAGTSSFTAQVADSKGATVTESLSITVNPAASPLSITSGAPPIGTVGVAYTMALAADGGTTPYTWSLLAGSLPAGLTLSSAGAITGTPTAQGTSNFTVQVADSAGATATATLSITVDAEVTTPLVITSGAPPSGTVGTAYTMTLGASGGTLPYAWSLSSGSLPSGLGLSTAGVIAGTPIAKGTSSFVVQVTDSTGATATATLSITINAATTTLSIPAITLPAGTVGSVYASSLSATGGTTPYTWGLASGSVPAGLTLSSTGSIAGTPTTKGTESFVAQVTDSTGATATVSLSITINAATIVLSIPATTLPSGTVGTTYTSSLSATGGSSPYTWSTASGSLPAGLTLSSSGAIVGTPTTKGTASFVAQVTDSAAATATVSLSITVNDAATPLSIPAATLPGGTVGTAYTSSLVAAGGSTPYAWSVLSGTLPPGLSLSSTGAITGTPTTTGSYSFVTQVKDSLEASASATFSIAVQSGTTLALTVSTLPEGTVGVAYQQSIGVTGGTSAYACSLVSGALPAGLNLGSSCVVSGTPSASGSSSFEVKVTDSSTPTQTITGTLTMTIVPATIVLNIGVPPVAVVGTPYTGSIPVTGGTGPYSCTITAGTLPDGLSLGAACSITGTPTTVQTSLVTVNVTDSASPANTGSSTVTFTVQAPAALSLTGSLPNATLGQAYRQKLTATGGVAPYTYAVTAGSLPSGLMLSTDGTVSGTPTAPGATSFTVTATDSEKTPQTASLSLVLLVTYPSTPYDDALKGPYAFLMQGYDDVLLGVLAYQTATVGSFTADGTGGLTAGEQDSNHQSSNPTSPTVATEHVLGTYTLSSDYRGSLTLTTLKADGTVDGTISYAIAAKVPSAIEPVTTNGTLIEDDGNGLVGSRGSGTFEAQTALATATSLSGGYAFGLQGDTPCLPSCTLNLSAGPVAAVGQFTVLSDGSLSGEEDANISSVNYPEAGLQGSASSADGSGRIQLTLSNSKINFAAFPTDYAVYMIDATHAYVLSTDKHSSYVMLAGSMSSQAQTTFSNNAMSGGYVGYENTASNPGLLGTVLNNVLNLSSATVFRGVATGTGTCNTTNVETGGLTGLINGLTGLGSGVPLLNALLGTYQSTGNSNCQVGSNGRVVLNYPVPNNLLTGLLQLLGLSTTPPPARIVYLSSNSTGYFLESGYAGIGHIEKQTGAPYTLGSLKGTFIYGTQPAASLATINASGTVIADGNGKAVSDLDLNVGVGNLNVIQLGVSGNYTYKMSDASAGRYTLGTDHVIYAISPSRFVVIDTNILTTSPSVALIY